MKSHICSLTALTLIAACGETAPNGSTPAPSVSAPSTVQPAPSSGPSTQMPTSSLPATSSMGSSQSTSSAEPTTTTTSSTSTTTTSEPATTAETATGAGSSDSDVSEDTGASSAATSSAPDETSAAEDLLAYAAGFHELYIHDECTDNNPADDVCAHARVHEVPFTFGGDPATTYDVKLRIRGLFEPTNLTGGETPYPAHPYFKVGGTVTKTDYSQWQIRITEPATVYTLNHYPTTGHTIYKEDFEATIRVRGGSAVVVRVEDANDRQIDNGYVGLPDRQQTIEGVTEGVVNGQVLRLDVLDVTLSAAP